MKIGLYADGDYQCKCSGCGKGFLGDKQALHCLRCAAAACQAENEQLNDLLESRCVPVGTPPIVCLCGSTRFMDAFFQAGWKFTLEGQIVLSVGVCKHAKDHGGEALGQDVADMLDELHFRKIDLADSVFVLNVGGYIGDSTRKEIEYAESRKKPIGYLEPLPLSRKGSHA